MKGEGVDEFTLCQNFTQEGKSYTGSIKDKEKSFWRKLLCKKYSQ